MTYEMSLAALSDPTRRQVFERVLAAPQPVGAIAEGLPVSRPRSVAAPEGAEGGRPDQRTAARYAAALRCQPAGARRIARGHRGDVARGVGRHGRTDRRGV